MTTEIHPETPIQHLPEAVKDASNHATETVIGLCHSAKLIAGEALTTSKEYARRNPLHVVLGAIAISAAIGYMIVRARRTPTFRERFAEDPLVSVREAVFSALSPVSQRVHDGYDSARGGVENIINKVQNHRSGHVADTLSDRITRVGNNLKFW